MPDDTVKIETASIEDLTEIVELLIDLFEMHGDSEADKEAQEQGLRLILEAPNRGRIFVLRNDLRIIGTVNLLFTISTAMGGMVILLEDFIIHPDHRGQGYGKLMVQHVRQFAQDKKFKRITLLTDKLSDASQNFFKTQGFQHSKMIPMRLVVD